MPSLPLYVEETPANLRLAAKKIEAGELETALWILKKISDQIESNTPCEAEPAAVS